MSGPYCDPLEHMYMVGGGTGEERGRVDREPATPTQLGNCECVCHNINADRKKGQVHAHADEGCTVTIPDGV